MSPPSILRKVAKATALPMGWGRARGPGDAVILLYHRVGDGQREIDLPTAVFERQLEELRNHHPIRSLDDVLEAEQGGVVVTFDDGLRDFHDHVLPLLVRYEVPALLYLATGFVANGRAPTDPGGEALTWSQLRDAVETRLVTLGSHTHSHVPLVHISEADAEGEMRRSKELIEDRLGVACRHFAYPFAVASPAAHRAACRLFDSVAWDAWRTNRRGATDPHRLGRTPVLRSDGPLFFRAKARGRLDGEGLIYRALRRGPWSL